MYIRNYMLPKDKLTTVGLNENLKTALDKINQGDFLSLPVLEDNEFKGIILKEAIYRRFFELQGNDREDYLLNTKVEEIYSSQYQSVQSSDRIENASYLLKEVRTPFLPVFDSSKFVGILTHFAIFNAFAEIFGIDKGTGIVVNMYDLPGQLAKLTDVIRKEGINIMNIAVLDPKVMDLMQVILRVDTEDVDRLVERIQQSGFRVGEVRR